MSDSTPKVVVLDFWSDNNRGDAAMQVGLLRLVRTQLPGCRITVVAAYGANQWPAFMAEFDETADEADAIVGGLRATFIPFGMSRLENPVVRKAANLAAVPFGLLLLPLWIVVLKVRWFDCVLPSAYRSTVQAIRSADLVVWNGRNFRCDSPRREPYEIWNLLYNPFVAIRAGKAVSCVGASIWPIHRPLSRRLLRGVMGRTVFTSLREQESFERATTILAGTRTWLELLPDLSLAVLPRTGPRRLWSAASDPRWPRRIGVTVVDWEGSGPGARAGYAAAIKALVQRMVDRGIQIRVIRQVSYANEPTTLIDDELAAMSELVEFRTQALTIDALTDEYAEVDLLVATRMHSAIFALASGTPVVTIPYDAGGKWGILDMLGASGVEVPYRGVSCEAIEGRILETWSRRDELMAEVDGRFQELRPAVELHVTMAMQRHQELNRAV